MEHRLFSQNGEDGITEQIFELIGFTNHYYVEFGVEDGSQCNTRILREKYHCNGLLMDGRYENQEINLNREFVTRQNIIPLLTKYGVPQTFDLLSIDIDYNDLYICHKLLTVYTPRVIIIEYNATHTPDNNKVVIYNPSACWDGSNYFGASLLAVKNMANHYGYHLIYCDNRGVNAFLIHHSEFDKISGVFHDIDNVEKLYKCPLYGTGPNGGHPEDRQKRPYVAYSEEFFSSTTWRDFLK